MKNFNSSLFVIALACYSFNVAAIKIQNKPATHYTYRQATINDASAVVDLINRHAIQDDNKIVIVPERFRLAYVESAIKEGRLFLACHNGQVIAYKKLFCITNTEERDDILNNELRFKETNLIAYGRISSIDNERPQFIAPERMTRIASSPTTTFIYSGADFTHPDHRGQGINGALTKHALNATSETILKHLLDKKSAHIAFVYGLTQENAGKEDNVLDGRTRGIVKQILPFFQRLIETPDNDTSSELLLSRYLAFKPSFDPHATECKPLSDEKSIPGYGCLIAYALKENNRAKNR